jgi:hypothetical protein
MSDKEQAYLGLVERHLADLEERIQEIKKRIAVMKVQGFSTQHQTELLATMLEVQENTKIIRLEMLERLSVEDKRSQG